MGGDFDHILVCFPMNCGALLEGAGSGRFVMIEITMNCDGGHRNAQATGLD